MHKAGAKIINNLNLHWALHYSTRQSFNLAKTSKQIFLKCQKSASKQRPFLIKSTDSPRAAGDRMNPLTVHSFSILELSKTSQVSLRPASCICGSCPMNSPKQSSYWPKRRLPCLHRAGKRIFSSKWRYLRSIRDPKWPWLCVIPKLKIRWLTSTATSNQYLEMLNQKDLLESLVLSSHKAFFRKPLKSTLMTRWKVSQSRIAPNSSMKSFQSKHRMRYLL